MIGRQRSETRPVESQRAFYIRENGKENRFKLLVSTIGLHCIRCVHNLLRAPFVCSGCTQWSVVAERSSALDSSSGVVRMWVRIPAWPVAALVSLSKTLNHNCFVRRMGRKGVGPVCCVMHARTLIVKEKGLAPVFLDSRLEHPAGWICAHY